MAQEACVGPRLPQPPLCLVQNLQEKAASIIRAEGEAEAALLVRFRLYRFCGFAFDVGVVGWVRGGGGVWFPVSTIQ